MIDVIITAGGSSSRFKGINKLLYKINNKPVIVHTVEKFLDLADISNIIISANKIIITELENLFANCNKIKIIQGGNTRQESVLNGLTYCKDPDYVIIHDAARPFIKKETILKCIENAKKYGASIVAVKTVDTIKLASADGFINSTLDRNFLWNAQTPQIFEYKKIFELHKLLKNKNFTDDSLLFEYYKYPVYITEGDYSNFKITTVDDISGINNNM